MMSSPCSPSPYHASDFSSIDAFVFSPFGSLAPTVLSPCGREGPIRNSFRSFPGAHLLEEGDYIVCDPFWLCETAGFQKPQDEMGRQFGEGGDPPVGAVVEWRPLRGVSILLLHVSEGPCEVAVVSSDGNEALEYVFIDSGVVALVPPRFLGESGRASAAWPGGCRTLTLSEPGWVSYSEENGWQIGEHALDVTGVEVV
jgi:hypothetical protein